MKVIAGSAGFVGPGRQTPPQALVASARRNIDLVTHRSTLVTQPVLSAADLVVVMAPEQALRLRETFGTIRGSVVVLGDLDPLRIRRRTIRDPWGGSDAVFEESYGRVERCVRELVRVLATARRAIPPADRS